MKYIVHLAASAKGRAKCGTCGMPVMYADSRQRRSKSNKKQVCPITLELYKVGSSPIAVARAEGVSPTTVTQVMKNKTVSARVRRRIARILGKKVEELWAA